MAAALVLLSPAHTPLSGETLARPSPLNFDSSLPLCVGKPEQGNGGGGVPLASSLAYVPGSLGEVLDERPQSSCSRPVSGALPFALLLFTKSRGSGEWAWE